MMNIIIFIIFALTTSLSFLKPQENLNKNRNELESTYGFNIRTPNAALNRHKDDDFTKTKLKERDSHTLESTYDKGQNDFKHIYTSNIPTPRMLISLASFYKKSNCIGKSSILNDQPEELQENRPIQLKFSSFTLLTTRKKRTKTTKTSTTTLERIKEYKVSLNGLQELVCGEKYGEDDNQVTWEKINGVSIINGGRLNFEKGIEYK